MIASKKDIFGYEIITDINNNIINTGNGQRLGSTPPSPDHRMNKLPVVGITAGLIDQKDIKNALCVTITFKVLSWREIKEDNNQ
ncbi:MAG: hypothetical protein J6568_06205 [Snodgrassella sp.]|nr:hypothetical protein [Snodgrassella sp.]